MKNHEEKEHNGLWAALVAGVMVVSSVLFAKYYKVRTEEYFDKLLRRHDLAVVLFYDKQAGGDTKEMLRIFREISKYESYDDADIAFISTDISRDDVAQVAKKYDVAQVPTYMLFEDGKLLSGTAMLTGFITTEATLKDFIDKHMGDRIDAILDKMKEKREERRRYSSGPHVSFGIGYGYYPYHRYYHYPYYRRPYFYQPFYRRHFNKRGLHRRGRRR